VKRLVLVTWLLAAAVALGACGAPVPDATAPKSEPAGHVESSITRDGLTYRLSVPAATLEAGSETSATYTVTNSTDATLDAGFEIPPSLSYASSEATYFPHVRTGGGLFNPPAMVGPRGVLHGSVEFVVPPPGPQSVALPGVLDPATGEPLTVEFVSVEPS